MRDLSEMTMDELLDIYNANSDKKVKKFSDKPTALRRTAALLDSLASPIEMEPPVVEEEDPMVDDAIAESILVEYEDESGEVCRSSSILISEAVKKSWENPKVAEKRSQRSMVRVDGVEFSSIAAAFTKFNIPHTKLGKFRKELKELERMDAFGKSWVIVPLNY